MTTLNHLFAKIQQRAGVALRFKTRGHWQELSWPEHYLNIIKLSSGLSKLDIKKGDSVAIMANTRFEWATTDMALMGMGVISVPIYHTASTEEVMQILQLTECETLVIETRALLKNLLPFLDKIPKLRQIILMDGTKEEIQSLADRIPIKLWVQVLESGSLDFQSDFEANCQSTVPEDVITILFTSGTSGDPKGVVLTHSSAYSEVSEAFTRLNVSAADSTLSFLPYSHILGRIENWGHLFSGYTMSFAEGIERIRANLLEVKPTILVAVPRIFEKVFVAIEAQLQVSPTQRLVAKKAVEIGTEVTEFQSYNRVVSVGKALQYELAKVLVLNKIKNAFGGRLRFAISGGAPLSSEIARFFHACGVLVLEGYGLSETTAAIAVNTPTAYRFGTVGKPIGDVKIKLAADGEILVSSKKVMREYYKNPEATKEALQGGWFATGDIGEWTDDGFLRITDRKKDLIKTAGGKYVAPQKLEVLMKAQNPIANVLIHGDQRKYIVALITLDKDALIRWARENGVTYSDYENLTQLPKVAELVRQVVSKVNSQLANFETIKRFKILPRDFTIEAGELTPSLKVKRKVLDKKFAREIDSLYV